MRHFIITSILVFTGAFTVAQQVAPSGQPLPPQYQSGRLALEAGKNQEAIEIYFNSAQSLHQRGSLDAANEALSHVLKLDPKHSAALLLRGQIAGESVMKGVSS